METTINFEPQLQKKLNLIEEIANIKSMHKQFEEARKRNNYTE